MAPGPNALSTRAPPIMPPSAFARLKAEMFVVAASSGAAVPYFMTRICIGGTLAKEVMPKTKGSSHERPFEWREEPDGDQRNNHRCRPEDERQSKIRVSRPATQCVADEETQADDDQHPSHIRGAKARYSLGHRREIAIEGHKADPTEGGDRK